MAFRRTVDFWTPPCFLGEQAGFGVGCAEAEVGVLAKFGFNALPTKWLGLVLEVFGVALDFESRRKPLGNSSIGRFGEGNGSYQVRLRSVPARGGR